METQTLQTTTQATTEPTADTVVPVTGEGEGETVAETVAEAAPPDSEPAFGLTPATGAVALLLVGLLAVAVVKLREKL